MGRGDSRGQTATEYIILLVIALVVVSIVVALLYQSTPDQVDDSASLITDQTVSTQSFSLGSNTSRLILQNTKQEPIRIDAIEINGTNCVSSTIPVTLSPRERVTITCANINQTSGKFVFDFTVNFTKTRSGGFISATMPKLEGDVAAVDPSRN